MKLKFKIFEIRQEMHITSNVDNTNYLTNTITQSCFNEANDCKSLKEASDWRDEHQKFYGQYVIIPCY